MRWKLPEADSYFSAFLSEDGYKAADLKDALKQCSRFRTAVDGGAHIGTWTAIMAGRFAKVISFEPATDTYQCLVENVRDYSNVVPVHAALGASHGRVTMRDDEKRCGNTGAREVVLGSGDTPIIPLDSHELADLDFLKLDVETHELQALMGASETIKRCEPLILIEVKKKHDWHNPHEAVGYLIEEHGYRKVGKVGKDWIFSKESEAPSFRPKWRLRDYLS